MKKVPIYLLLGSELLQKKDEIKNILKLHGIDAGEHSAQKVMYFASETAIEEILTECLTLPFFAKNKAVIVQEAEKLSFPILKDYLLNYSEQTILILVSDQPSGKFSSPIEKIVKQVGELIMFWPMFEDKMEKWAERKAREYGIMIPVGLGAFLVDQCGRNTLLIEKNLQVLLNFFASGAFTLDDAARIMNEEKEVSVFLFIKELFLGNVQDSIEYFRRIVYEGESMLFILKMIHRQLELLWKYKSVINKGQQGPSLMGVLGVGKLALKEIAVQSGKRTLVQIAMALSYLYEIEKSLKSDPAEVKLMVFENTILKISRDFSAR